MLCLLSCFSGELIATLPPAHPCAVTPAMPRSGDADDLYECDTPRFINTPAMSPPEISDPAELGLVHGREEARMSRLPSWNPKQRICPWHGRNNISIWRRERTQYKVS